MQRDPSLIQFNDLSTFSQKKFERARSKFLLDKLTGKLNNPDYFLQLERTMAELTGTDTDERLAEIFGKSPHKPGNQVYKNSIIGGPNTDEDHDYF